MDVGGDVRMGQISYAYIDGACQGWLPQGEVIADVARGFEYEPIRTKVEIKPGQRELELRGAGRGSECRESVAVSVGEFVYKSGGFYGACECITRWQEHCVCGV